MEQFLHGSSMAARPRIPIVEGFVVKIDLVYYPFLGDTPGELIMQWLKKVQERVEGMLIFRTNFR